MTRGRKKGYSHDEKTRQKIQASQLLNRLTDCAMGLVELTPSQVRAAEVLLRKCMPDLQSIDNNINDNRTTVKRINLAGRQPELIEGVAEEVKGTGDDEETPPPKVAMDVDVNQ